MTETATVDPFEKISNLLAKVRPIKTNFDLIRLGSAFDGGYLVPDDLEGIVACFSPGVSQIADFELDMAKRGIPCFLADYSVDAPPVESPLFHFEKKFLGKVDEAEFITLEDWMRRNAPARGDMVLQMDIEGAEFPVLSVTSREALRRFRIIVIEFHNLPRMFVDQHFPKFSAPFFQLLEDFEVVHIHPNNCCGNVTQGPITMPKVVEFTFLRKDRITHREYATAFPHPLDARNVLKNPELVLPDCWFGNGTTAPVADGKP